MTDKVKKLKQSLYGSDWKPEDDANINNLSKNNKYIYNKAHSGSGYQPKAGKEFKPKKYINTNPPHVSTSNKEATEEIVREHNHNYVDISAYANPDIDYSDSLFDPNEKDPVMRALNMVKEYCNVSIRRITQHKNITTDCFKVEAYKDVINFIEEHQKKCQDVKSYSPLDLDKLIESTDSSYIKHLENEIEWFKGRMDDYKKSFFMICDLIKSSNVSESIKYFVEREEKRY